MSDRARVCLTKKQLESEYGVRIFNAIRESMKSGRLTADSAFELSAIIGEIGTEDTNGEFYEITAHLDEALHAFLESNPDKPIYHKVAVREILRVLPSKDREAFKSVVNWKGEQPKEIRITPIDNGGCFSPTFLAVFWGAIAIAIILILIFGD